VLWASQIERRKGLPLFLRAAAALRAAPVRFVVAGDGPERRSCERLACRLGLADRVTFLGAVPWPAMPEVFRSAHLFVFPSLRDVLGTVVLEAMSYGCPVICLDHQGCGAFLPDDAAVKLPVTGPRAAVVAIGQAIGELARDRARLGRMSTAALRYAASQNWATRAGDIAALYRTVLAARAAAASRADGQRGRTAGEGA
jgi:glycosyltransferase involved in cell wall biosynthesis